MENARKFLARAVPWPQEGDDWWISIHPGRASFGRAFKRVDPAIRYIEWCRETRGEHKGSDIYVCMSAQALVRPKQRPGFGGQIRYEALRSIENALWLRSIWLDLDLQSSHTTSARPGYADLTTLLAALAQFLIATGLPPPSIKVSSGNGVHIYWCFEEPLPVHEWLQLSLALAAAAAQFLPIKPDIGGNSNAAFFLRVPDTFNYKSDPPKPVGLLVDGWGDVYSVERIRAVLAPFIGTTPTPAAPRVLGQSILGPKFEVRPPLPFDMRERYPELGFQGSIDDVAGVCPFIAETLESGGAGLSEAVWRQSLAVAYYTNDPTDAAYRLSLGYGGSSEQEIDKKLGEIEKYRLRGNYGWPRCQTIHRDGATQCATCPHLAAAKTPFHFVNAAPPPQPVDLKVNGLNGTHTVLPPAADAIYLPLPSPYIDDGDHLIYKMVDGKNEGDPPVREYICEQPVWGFWVQAKNNQRGEHALNYSVQTDATAVRHVQLPNKLVHDTRAMLTHIGDQGHTIGRHDGPKYGDCMTAFITQLRNVGRTALPVEGQGWVVEDDKPIGFVYGNKLHTKEGERPVASAVHDPDGVYQPRGDLEVFRTCAKLITDQGNPGLNVALAATVAAPLVICTGLSGVVICLQGETGRGKTTACRVGASAWMEPFTGIVTINATNNALDDALSRSGNTPVYVDDMQMQEKAGAKTFVDMLISVGQGRGRARVDRTGKGRSIPTFNTLMLVTSNYSMAETVADRTKNTEAGVMRLFELVVPKIYQSAVVGAEVDATVRKLKNNSGRAGEVLAQYFGANGPEVWAYVEKVNKSLWERLKVKNEERFWVATITVLCVGAEYLNRLGLATIDTKQLMAFLLEQFQRMRRERSSEDLGYSKPLDLLNEFLNDRRQSILVTDYVWMDRGKPPTNWQAGGAFNVNLLRGRIAARLGRVDRRLLISIADLRAWAAENGYQGKSLVKAVMERVLLPTAPKLRLGAHTPIETQPEFAIYIDCKRVPELSPPD